MILELLAFGALLLFSVDSAEPVPSSALVRMQECRKGHKHAGWRCEICAEAASAARRAATAR